jgi:undecaprenyl diphosphate synthase
MQVSPLPSHVALIPDGNRRWARKRGLHPWEGHREGFRNFRKISEELFNRGVPYVTLWAASEDNLRKRTKAEVRFLLRFFRDELAEALASDAFVNERVRVRVIGRWQSIVRDRTLSLRIGRLEEKTRTFTKRNLTILFGYDGKREMLEAIKTMLRAGLSRVSEGDLRKALWTGHLPPVDLVIRTGGEPHWSSGFMMWLTADSQFFFTETLWPDFDTKVLDEALRDYARRERRFGK